MSMFKCTSHNQQQACIKMHTFDRTSKKCRQLSSTPHRSILHASDRSQAPYNANNLFGGVSTNTRNTRNTYYHHFGFLYAKVTFVIELPAMPPRNFRKLPARNVLKPYLRPHLQDREMEHVCFLTAPHSWTSHRPHL